jgi:hypothetical protein
VELGRESAAALDEAEELLRGLRDEDASQFNLNISEMRSRNTQLLARPSL